MGSISPEARAAIDKAVADGRVQKIPSGVSGIRWDEPHDWKAQRDRHFGRKPDPTVAARRERVRAAHAEGKTVAQIVKDLHIGDALVRIDLAKLGLKVNPAHPAPVATGKQTVSQKRAERAERHANQIRDRRRFKTVPVPFGEVSRMAPQDATGTIFPTRVFDPGAENVLVDGCNNAKIGGDVLKGRLKGARIMTLTLEERATCPRSCAIWHGCYGNSMQYSRRWRHGAALEAKIEAEIVAVCSQHERVLVRLHVLGDFYSMDYLALWTRLLDEHEGLHVFGFTAWGPKTEIGAEIARVREALGARFSIRHSGTAARWGSFTLDGPTSKHRLGDAIVCPEQAEAMKGRQGRHCGNCCLCWQSDAAIVFIEH